MIAAHEALGNTLLPWAIATFIVALVQWVWFRFFSLANAKPRVASKAARVLITVVLAAAVAVTAVGSVVTVVRVGESGAKAIWSGSFAG
ncbi:hypothetical protein [Glaciihabitans sp. UYNi722]|uniref:hypothetical protein n=1 Tax=Glaciihabitans sp. UYNi722 TaxID=3156344 RepID=UPI00339B8637